MTFDAVVCVTKKKQLKFVLHFTKALPFTYFATYQLPRYHILYTVTIKNLTS